MDQQLLSHVLALVVGVLATALFLNIKKKEFNEHSTVRSNVAVEQPQQQSSSSSGGGKKKNKKKNKKKGGSGGAASAANTDTEASEDEVAAPAPPRAAPPPEAFHAAAADDEKAKQKKADDAAAALIAEEEEKKSALTTKAAAASSSSGGGGKKKKKKKNKNKGGGGAAAGGDNGAKENQAPQTAAASTTKTDNVAPPKPEAAVAEPVVVPLQPRAVVKEEWSTIPVQKKRKKKPKASLSPVRTAVAEAAAEMAPIEKTTVIIDASRVGIIIGPKGETLKKIEERAGGVKLDVNAPKPEETLAGGNAQSFKVIKPKPKKPSKATIVITEGTAEAQNLAKKAILELADRGYAVLLQSETFLENSVSVHPRYLSEIVGPKGKIINAIQSELDVKLTIPKTDWNPKSVQVGHQIPSCRVGVAGDDPKNVKLAKQVIKDICNYHYHEITHPGMSHQEVYVPQEFFHCVIGPRGSEIKHIRGNYKVDVYMPNSESVSENVICVGRPNDVEKAISYIKLLMDRDTELREQKYSDEHFGDDSMGW